MTRVAQMLKSALPYARLRPADMQLRRLPPRPEPLGQRTTFPPSYAAIAFACFNVVLGLNGFELTAKPADIIAFIYDHLKEGTFRKRRIGELTACKCRAA